MGSVMQFSTSQVKPFIKTIKDTEYICKILHNAFKIGNVKVLSLSNLITDALSHNDNRKFHPSFEAEKAEKIKGLIDRETWKVFLEREIKNDANCRTISSIQKSLISVCITVYRLLISVLNCRAQFFARAGKFLLQRTSPTWTCIKTAPINMVFGWSQSVMTVS